MKSISWKDVSHSFSLAEFLGMPVSQGSHKPFQNLFEVTEPLFPETICHIHTLGFHNTSNFGAKLDLLVFRAFSQKGFFLMGPVFMSNQHTDPLVESVKGDGSVYLPILAPQLTGIELVGDSLLGPNASEDTIP